MKRITLLLLSLFLTTQISFAQDIEEKYKDSPKIYLGGSLSTTAITNSSHTPFNIGLDIGFLDNNENIYGIRTSFSNSYQITYPNKFNSPYIDYTSVISIQAYVRTPITLGKKFRFGLNMDINKSFFTEKPYSNDETPIGLGINGDLEFLPTDKWSIRMGIGGINFQTLDGQSLIDITLLSSRPQLTVGWYL